MYFNDYNRRSEDPQNKPAETIYTEAYRISEPEWEFQPKKKKHSFGKIAALCLVCALTGGVLGGAVTHFTGIGNHATLFEGSHTPVAVSMANVKADDPLTIPQIYAANVGSSVGITTELVTTNLWHQPVAGAAAGSGFVVSEDGYILTNYHVINGATSIKVTFQDGTKYDARLIGGEEENDIAVLKIDAQGLTPVTLGDSDNLVVGEQVCAIGNPLGELTYSLTVGYVSAKDRSITMENGEVMNMLQTDTAINSGNSGGPLFNMYGQVIGITTAKYAGSSTTSGSASIEGLGFAIPINDVKDIVTDIIQYGVVTNRPNVGIIMNEVSSEATRRYNVPSGAYVEAVLDGSCAQRSGLKSGDVITAVNDSVVTSPTQLKAVIKEYHPGDTVNVTIYRDGQNQTLSLTLDENTQERGKALEELQNSVQQAQAQQQQQNSTQNYYNWPFDFGW